MLIFLIVVWLLLAGLDVYATCKFGFTSELNPLAKKLMRKWGVKLGAAVGIGVPAVVLAVLTALIGSEALAAFFVGLRSCLCYFQVLVFKLSKS